jgi:spore coat polysaccharide biosynthesis protein SpsF
MTVIGAIVQARLGSTRLPGKTLLDIAGRPLIDHVMRQVGAAGGLDTVVLATTDDPADDPLADHAAARGWNVFRGSREDVLDRFHQAAVRHGLDGVVRVTGDCPLKDPELIDWAVGEFRDRDDLDYLATNFRPHLPLGMDVDIFRSTALARSWREARLPSEREHVNPYIRKHRERFRLGSLVHPVHGADARIARYRVAVDEPADLEVVRHVIGSLAGSSGRVLHLADVVGFLDAHPEVARLSSSLVHHAGYLPSLERDLRSARLSLPPGLDDAGCRDVLATVLSEWMGARFGPEDVVIAPREGAGVTFDLRLHGDILDGVDLPEVRVRLRAETRESAAAGRHLQTANQS